jgi:hypothetical protein
VVGNLTEEENEVKVYLNLVMTVTTLLQQIALRGLVNVVVANCLSSSC